MSEHADEPDDQRPRPDVPQSPPYGNQAAQDAQSPQHYQPQPQQYQPQPQQYQPQPQQYQPQQYQQPYQSELHGSMTAGGYGYPGQIVVQPAPSNGVGTAGFVTGLLGLIFCWVPGFGLVLGALGVILGGVGISTGHKKGAGTGLAIAGLILGLVSLVPSIIIMAAVSNVNTYYGMSGI